MDQSPRLTHTLSCASTLEKSEVTYPESGDHVFGGAEHGLQASVSYITVYAKEKQRTGSIQLKGMEEAESAPAEAPGASAPGWFVTHRAVHVVDMAPMDSWYAMPV